MEEVTDKTVPKETMDAVALRAITENITTLTVAVDTLSKLVGALLHNSDQKNFDIPVWTTEEEYSKDIGDLVKRILEAQSGTSETDKS